ncbi:hypothetical protein HPB50_021060 [Hyalomma asiaticum]|uniref:Uncharacterized protein n=1 Tax=Hyalomma asiaticum TaxID=266040 RepID=A0ACB7S7M1_HYAAI|nr:hypothetical protein HPB50_021060 [Hyalomma asiaticum]
MTTDDEDYLVDDYHRIYYLALFAFLTISTMLKTIQRHIRVPYTLIVFVVAAGCTTLFAMTSRRIDFYYSSIGVQAITVFMPAFVVHTTQGINNYIFRRCHVEIVVFSLGTFGISLAMATMFVMHRIADSTWPFRECLLFGVYMCCVERLPMSDALFEEGRYPVMTTMMQSETLFNAVMTWCIFGYYRFHSGDDLDPLLPLFPLHNQGVAILVGFLMGTATICLLESASVLSGDSAITVIVCGTYFAYFLLEIVRSSGVTGVVVYTLTVNSHRFVACTDLSRSLEDYWGILYDVTGTLASCVSASYTAVLLIQYASTLDWEALCTCYVVKVAIRCMAVVLLYPVIGHFGYQVTVRQAMVLAWTCVKGTFLASTATVQHLRRENVYTESITKSYLYAIGDMVLTQLINVTFLPAVLGTMGVLEVSDVELRTMRDAVQYLKEAADSARTVYMKDDSFLLADWRWVTRSTIVRNPLEATFRFQSTMSTGCVVRLRRVPRHIETLAVENVLRIEQKENLGTAREKGLIDDTSSGSEVLQRPLRERVVELFEHAYYEVVITSSTMAVVLVLAGLVRIMMLMPGSNAFIGAITVEALYLAMFTTEVTVMVSSVGSS